MMEWYIAIQNEAKKIPEEVLIYKIKNKELPSDTLVVNDKIKNWVEIKKTDLWKKYAGNLSEYPNVSKFVSAEIPQSTSKVNGSAEERCLGLAITGFVFALIGFFILPIVFSVMGLIFGIIAVGLNPSENGECFKAITKYKNKARGFGLSALICGVIGVVVMIFNMLHFGGYL